MKPILILLALALSAHAGENPYESIAERNAFNLTDKKPTPTLPPVKKILAPSVFLTGITRIDGIKKVHFVLRKAGDQDKFVSLATNEKQYNIELKKILNDSAYISNNGETNLLSFKTNSLPTMVTKAPSKNSKTSDSEKREALLKRVESYRSRERDKRIDYLCIWSSFASILSNLSWITSIAFERSSFVTYCLGSSIANSVNLLVCSSCFFHNSSIL